MQFYNLSIFSGVTPSLGIHSININQNIKIVTNSRSQKESNLMILEQVKYFSKNRLTRGHCIPIRNVNRLIHNYHFRWNSRIVLINVSKIFCLSL